MNHRKPPLLARWMLEHLALGSNSDALTGDILEEFLSGRSCFWYWREVLFAIAVGFLREVRRRRSILGFALLWTLATPALTLCYFRFLSHSDQSRLWSLPWPWSMICDIAITLGPLLVFLWFGMTLYLALNWWISRAHSIPRFGRGLLCSLVTYALIYAFLLSIPHSGHPHDIRAVTVASIYSDPWFMLSCVPGFLVLSVSIWAALPRPRRTQTRIAR